MSLNEAGGRHLREVSRKNIHKPMAVVLFEKGKGEVLTVATIQSELGSRFQITGMGSAKNAGDLALLLRAGALAAPMDIIEERNLRLAIRGWWSLWLTSSVLLRNWLTKATPMSQRAMSTSASKSLIIMPN